MALMEAQLEYCISLRDKGYTSEQLKLILTEKGLSNSDVAILLKESDNIYLYLLIDKYSKTRKKKSGIALKTVVLFVSLFFLMTIFFGHARIGIIFLILFWASLRSLGVLGMTWRRIDSDSKFNRWKKIKWRY